jgi:hypothetical protein
MLQDVTEFVIFCYSSEQMSASFVYGLGTRGYDIEMPATELESSVIDAFARR